jgi:transcription elongation factor Elf1
VEQEKLEFRLACPHCGSNDLSYSTTYSGRYLSFNQASTELDVACGTCKGQMPLGKCTMILR